MEKRKGNKKTFQRWDHNAYSNQFDIKIERGKKLENFLDSKIGNGGGRTNSQYVEEQFCEKCLVWVISGWSDICRVAKDKCLASYWEMMSGLGEGRGKDAHLKDIGI